MSPLKPRGADLHLHTVYSDGAYTPEDLVAAATDLAFKAVAITDHDSLEALEPVRRAAGEKIEIIAGAEFGTPTDERPVEEIHIVGLFLNPSHDELLDAFQRYRGQRRARVLRICEKLNQIGVTVRPDDVFQLAGAGNLSRLHVAQALVRAGRARSIGSAFKRWLGPRGAAYIPRERPPVAETILLIHRAGGVAVMAHPGQTARDEEIPRMAEAGLDGIEVYCPDHSPSQERHYLGLARQHRLLPGGGSDCHGHGKDNLTLGKVRVDDVDVDALRNRATSRS